MADTTHDEHQLLIGGRWVDAVRRHLRHRQPGDRRGRRDQAPNATTADADAAAAAAREALPAWPRCPPRHGWSDDRRRPPSGRRRPTSCPW